MKQPERVIAFAGDFHFGSRVGLWPEVYYTKEGHPITASPGQLHILECFKDFCGFCDRQGVDTVVSLAEILNGANPAKSGQHQMEANMNVQADAAYDVLKKYYVKDREFWAVKGTDYHDARYGSIEKELVERLGGKWFGIMQNLTVKGTDIRLNVCHGAGGGAIYDATNGDAEIKEHLVAQAEGKVPHIDLFVRGHLHVFYHLKKHHGAYLQVPCWQDYCPDYNKIVKRFGKYQPDIGGVVVAFWKDRYAIWEKLYPLPRTHTGMIAA